MWMRKNPSALGVLPISILFAAVIQWPANAGSNNGSIAPSSGFSCDNRVDLRVGFQTWCTPANAALIRNQCFAVVHSSAAVQRCGWQGCGSLSLVGQKPKLVGNNVVEYGISTPHGFKSIPQSWQMSGDSVLPQYPFPRTYLTIDQFLKVREQCGLPSSSHHPDVVNLICSASKEQLEMSPYYVCLKSQKLAP